MLLPRRQLSILVLLGHFFVVESSVNQEPLKYELFSSSDELQNLVIKEAGIRSRLKDYLQKLNKQIDALDKLVDKNLKENVTEDMAEEYVSDPINTFAMIKRAVLQWPKAKEVVFNESLAKDWEEINKDLDKFFPGTDDIHGAFSGIFLLHETYEMDLKKFSKGIIEIPGGGGQTTVTGERELADEDLETLSKLSFNRGFYHRACEWAETALWKAIEDKAKKSRVKQLQKLLTMMTKKHDEILISKKASVGRGWRTFALPFDPELRKKKRFRKIMHQKQRPEAKVFKPLDDQGLWDNFNALCRGELLRPADMDAGLRCRFLHYGDPYLRMGPFKLEPLHEQRNLPFVSVFRDFMPDSESNEYLDRARGNLMRSQHHGKDGATGKTSIKRTSSQTWMAEYNFANDTVWSVAATKMSLRLKLATRLHTHMLKGAEPYQIANYGIGGVYNHHTDASGPEMTYKMTGENEVTSDFENGDRIATAMAYLTDVAAGGATVFPNLGVTIWPKKGDVAFWFNIDRNLRLDFLTHHGGCPVLAGSKWITNKWIRNEIYQT